MTSALNTFIITGKNEEKIRNFGNDVMRKVFNLGEKSTIAPLYVKAGMLPFNTQLHLKTINLFLRILATNTPCTELVREIGDDTIPLKANWTKYCLAILRAYDINGAERWLEKGAITRENVKKVQNVVKKTIELTAWNRLVNECKWMTMASHIDLTDVKYKKISDDIKGGDTYHSINAKMVKSWLLTGSYKTGKFNGDEKCTYCKKDKSEMRWKHYVICEELKRRFSYQYENIRREIRDETWHDLMNNGKLFLRFLLNPTNSTLGEYSIERKDEKLSNVREKADWLIFLIHNQLSKDYKRQEEKISRF